MPVAYTLTASYSCEPSGATLTVEYTYNSGGGPIGSPMQFYIEAAGTRAPISSNGDTATFPGVVDGLYTVVLLDSAEAPLTDTTIEIDCAGGGGGSSCDLAISNVEPTAATVIGGTGGVSMSVTTSAATFTATVTRLSDNATFPLPNVYQSGTVVLRSVPVGSYRINFTDSNNCTKSATYTISQPTPPAPVGGCTDKSATNYNADATAEDGTCVYQVPVRTPVFSVPRLNPLRFVLEQVADNCATFETLDNVLFCQQHRPGQQLRPHYRQKVQYCDPLTVQVHTNFDAVTAEICRSRNNNVVRTIPLELVQRHTGTSDPLPVVLSEYPGGYTALSAADGLPLTLRQAARVVLSGGATGTYQVREVTITPAGELSLVLNRPWQAPAAGVVEVRWQLSTVRFNVWEAPLSFNDLAEGDYYVQLRATDGSLADVVAVSEPIWLAERHENTVVVDYSNRDNAYGMVWTTGIVSRLRVPGTFFLPDPAGASTLHRSSPGTATLLTSTVQRQIILETGGLPDYLHELLFAALRVDTIRVQGQRALAPGDYKWTRLRPFPLSAGSITLEVADGFGSGNGHDDGALPATDNLLELRRGGFLKLR